MTTTLLNWGALTAALGAPFTPTPGWLGLLAPAFLAVMLFVVAPFQVYQQLERRRASEVQEVWDKNDRLRRDLAITRREANQEVEKLRAGQDAQSDRVVRPTAEEIHLYTRKARGDRSGRRSGGMHRSAPTVRPEPEYATTEYRISELGLRVLLHEEVPEESDPFHGLLSTWSISARDLPGVLEVRRLDEETIRIVLEDEDDRSKVTAYLARRMTS